MQRLKYVLVMLLTLAYLAIPAMPLRAAGANLIENPTVETETDGQPANWAVDKWGANTTAHTYAADGHTGKSLRVDMTAHTNGDAKWRHDQVAVAPNTSYTYTSFYKSNVGTEIDLEYTDAAGNVSYTYVQYVAPAADWTPLTAVFTTPANVAKVRVMHIIAAAGWVQTDDFSLTETTTTPPVVTPPATTGNLIANESFETANGATPAGWVNNNWGVNTAQFTYNNIGRTGSRSVTTTLTAATSGDAKWYANSVAITAGATYTYSDWYKSNVSTGVVVQYQDAAGNFTYAGLAPAAAAGDWTQYQANFTAPATAVRASVFHIVETVGSLTIDDVSLAPATAEPPHDHEDGENIVHNGSMEEATGTKPTDWISNNWGTNTAQFTYENTGRTGSKSVKTTVTAYTGGDAKWYFAPINVIAGKEYIYRDYYKATVATNVVVAYVDAAGNYTYQYIGAAPAAADWTQYQTTITIPAAAAKATVFHLIDAAGTLQLDDVLLQVAVPTTTTPIDVPNGSLEEGDATPFKWQSSNWGTNAPTFQHVTGDAHTGTKSIRVTMDNYVDGDAKWFFDPIATLTPGEQYRFTAWYKGTATPHVVALYIDANGKEQYVGLPSPLTVSATQWTKFTDTFTVPQNAKYVSVFMFVNQNGWLQTDDYSITAYHPNGFSRPLLSLTFDDGHEENYTNALPIMERYGFKSTQCYATSFIEGQSQAVINGVRAFYDAGHEICSHTVTHPALTTVNPTQLNYELQHSQQYLQNLLGIQVKNFATPYGDYNAVVNDAIDNYYQSHRTVDEGFNSKDNFNIYRLRVQNILDTTTAAQVTAWIEQAKADNTWLILVYHRVAPNPGPYDSYVTDFEEQMAAVAASGITVKTYQGALEEILPQL